MPLTIDTLATPAEACDEIVRELLEEVHVYGPPVDALELADRLNLQVVFDAEQAGRARIKRLCGGTAIFLRPDDRPERLQWAVAHEIGEAMVHRIAPLIDGAPASGGEIAAARREQLANEFASRLLLPTDYFLPDAEELDGDVPRLKELHHTASHELILTNLLRLPGLALVTVFDHGRVTRRRGNGQLPPPKLLPQEVSLWREVHESGAAASIETAEVRVQAWAVHEPGWKRELLRTTPGVGVA